MSSMSIEVIANPVSTVPTAKGSYQVIDLAYKNKSFQDKLEGKKVMSFTNKDVFAALQKAQFGDIFEVSRVKNDKGFWDWTAVASSNGAVASSNGAVSSGSANTQPAQTQQVKTGTVTPKSNYETAEERAARQVLIVRQSSLSNAMEYATANKIKSEEEIKAMAQRFVDWVFNKQVKYQEEVVETPPANFFEDFENDLP